MQMKTGFRLNISVIDLNFQRRNKCNFSVSSKTKKIARFSKNKKIKQWDYETNQKCFKDRA